MKKRSGEIAQLFLMAFLILLMIPVLVSAGTDTEEERTDLTELSLEELMQIKVGIVYAASKYEEKVTEAPSSISIITADDIKRYGYRTLAEILQSIRGFTTTYDRNYHYLTVRGFGLPGDYNSRILLLVDGHSIKDNIYYQGSIGTAFPIDIDIVERVEIVRGPSSSLYGTSAFFAVINVITRGGSYYKGVEVSGEYGSFETYGSRLTYGNRFENGLEILLSATYSDSEGDDDLYYEEFDNPGTNNGVAEDLDYGRHWKLFAEASFHDFTFQGVYSYRKKGVPTAPWGVEFNDSSMFTEDDYYWLDLKYDHTFANQLNLLARVNYNHYYYDGDYPYDWGPPDRIVINNDKAEGTWLYGEVQLNAKVHERNRVTVGAAFQDNMQQDQMNWDYGYEDTPNLDSEEDSTYWAAYIQDELTITDTLHLNAGIRYDDYKTFGSTANPRAALIYNPLEKTTFKAIYGQAFRAPNAYELYYHDGLFTTKPSEELDPETIRTYELVWEQYVGNSLRGTVVGFYYEIDDLISYTVDPAIECDSDWDGVPDSPCFVYENVDEVEAKGIEFELEGKWESGLEGRISYSYQETEDKSTGQILPNSSKHLAKLNLIFPLVKGKVFAGIEEQYTGERKTVSGNESADYYITNVTLFSKNFLMKNMELSFSIYNLLDEEYDDPGSEEHVQDTIEQDGRTWRLKLTYTF